MVLPPFLSDMCSIIIRFRSFTYGLSTDKEKAFLHVGLDGDDKEFTRFLWLSDTKNPESEFQVFRLKTVVFGSTNFPFMLNAKLHRHLENYTTPVANDIKNNMYVDNVISGCDQETELISYYQEPRSIMNAANFNLRSGASNSPLLLEKTGQDQTADTSTVVTFLVCDGNQSKIPSILHQRKWPHLPVNQPPNVMYYNSPQGLTIHWDSSPQSP